MCVCAGNRQYGEHYTSHTHLRHINTRTFRFIAKAQGQTLVRTRAHFTDPACYPAAHTHTSSSSVITPLFTVTWWQRRNITLFVMVSFYRHAATKPSQEEDNVGSNKQMTKRFVCICFFFLLRHRDPSRKHFPPTASIEWEGFFFFFLMAGHLWLSV